MSEITANIVVQPLDLNVTVEQPTITVAPEALGLQFYLGGIGIPGGNVNTVQYNAGGVLGGIPNATWTGTKLSLGSVNDITISGGSANYALITDGAGNLSWGSIANSNYANFAGTAYSVNAANVVGTVANANYAAYAGNANYAAYAGNVTIANQPNITTVGTLTALAVSGISNFSGNLNFTGARANLGTVSNVKVTGGTNGQYLQTDGTGNLSWAAGGGSGNGVVGGSNTQVQFNDAGLFGGSASFVFDKSSNSLSVTTLSSSAVANLPYGSEAVTITTTAPNTYNLDILSSSVVLCTANATANTILNIRGNSTVAANTLVSVGQSITNTIVIKTGSTPYTVTTLQVDGANQTINWVSGAVPSGAANSLTAFTFTIIKTAATPTYTVLGGATRYA